MSAAEKVKEISRGADRLVAMAEKLTAQVITHSSPKGDYYRLVLGTLEVEEFEVARFTHGGDAEIFARAVNEALGPIVESSSRAFLRTLCQDVHDALDEIEQGPGAR
jgi:hypothetical protein